MSIINQIKNDTLAFSIQDVDNSLQYLIAINTIAEELAEQMGIPVPSVSEFEDETGYYIIVKTKTAISALNYIDLFLDALTCPEIELDLDHLQLFTNNNIVFQRFSNAKQQFANNLICLIFESLQELEGIEKQVLSLESILDYNSVPNLRNILNVIANSMESNGIEVAQKINEVAKLTVH